MENYASVVSSVLGVFLVMGVGAFCRRRGWLTRQADQSLARLCANVFLPAYLASRIIEGPRLETFSVIATPCAFGFAATAAGILIGRWVAKLVGHRVGLDTSSKQRAFGWPLVRLGWVCESHKKGRTCFDSLHVRPQSQS